MQSCARAAPGITRIYDSDVAAALRGSLDMNGIVLLRLLGMNENRDLKVSRFFHIAIARGRGVPFI
jgi:hypothetical protein